jgi:hypothetical protein
MSSNPFANVSLKKVQTKEQPKANLVQLCEDENQYRQMMQETYLGITLRLVLIVNYRGVLRTHKTVFVCIGIRTT